MSVAIAHNVDADDVDADDVADRVVQIAVEILSLGGPPPSLDSRISDDLGADSIDLFSLVSALEDEFGGTIEENDMDAMQTLRDIVEYIQSAHARRQ